MKRFNTILLCLAFFAFGIWACSSEGGNDSGDDDDASSGTGANYGQDIEGNYPAVVTYATDTCEQDLVGTTEDWMMEIIQSKNFSTAAIYYVKPGVGSEKVLLFHGKVYGTTVVMNDIEEVPIGSEACTKIHLQTYYINIDLTSGVGSLSGSLMDDIFYLGQACDASMQNCRSQRELTSTTSDDDTA